MSWEKPSFVELEMNAEIGAYQNDFADEREWVAPEAPAVEPEEEP
jgi:hypothetical protein